jgi:biotin carboxyl carrier protein
MKRLSLIATIALGVLMGNACGKKEPEQSAQNQTPPAAQTNPNALASQQAAETATTPEAAAPNDLPADVTLTDGSTYHGVLVSKTGSQLTFRGDNGGTRTFDSRDIKSIKFGTDSTQVKSKPLTRENKQPQRMAQNAPAQSAANPPAETASTPQSAPAAAPEPPRQIVIPSGTQISVRTNEAIDSKTASPGQTFSAVISQAVRDEGGDVAIPRGASAALVVKQAGAGKVHANNLILDMQSVTVGGRSYEVESSSYSQKGKEGVGANKRTAKYTGGGAAIGAIIGAIAGGGKGAAIGAATGAGAGAGTQIFTRGSVKIPAESVLTFQLQAPLQLDAR